MASEVVSQRSGNNEYAPTLVDKAFFGKDNCLALQVRPDACYFRWGKKDGDAWTWKNVKCSDIECGQIIDVLEGKEEKVSFYHSFQDSSVKIFFTRKEKSVVCSADGFSKGLSRGEQVVLATLLRHSIWMMNMVS